jgi:hypothetical protein
MTTGYSPERNVEAVPRKRQFRNSYGKPQGKPGCGTAQCGKSARWEMEGIDPLAVTGREWDATPLPTILADDLTI